MTDTLRRQLARIARTYANTSHVPCYPVYEIPWHAHVRRVRNAYKALCLELWSQFVELEQTVNVVFTSSDPYRTSADMFADIERLRLMQCLRRL